MARDGEGTIKTTIRAACWAILDSPKVAQVGGAPIDDMAEVGAGVG